jgi:hypothetical protein
MLPLTNETMPNDDKPKPDFEAGLKALATPTLVSVVAPTEITVELRNDIIDKYIDRFVKRFPKLIMQVHFTSNGQPPIPEEFRTIPETVGVSSSHDGAPHSQRLPGPVKLALCAVDQRSGARVAVAKVRGAGFGVDSGTLFAGLGSDPAEAGATSVRTKSDGGAEMAGGRISIDSSPGATV